MKMSVNGLYAEINTPVAPTGEGINRLPPYDQQPAYVVEEYEYCPSNWIHGSAKASSYFMALNPGRHLWIDFNSNSGNSHHVAVVISIQGINPITGQQTKELRLEKYVDKCPVHNADFGQDRYCDACGYKWPAQNYMSTTSTPRGEFWIDGFRAQDGTVRGFLITEDTVRGVANQLIGEDRVFAIGIAFYLSKEERPRPPQSFLRTRTCGMNLFPQGMSDKSHDHGMVFGSHNVASLSCVHEEPTSAPITYYSDPNARGINTIEIKKLEIGAGAKISQELSYPDKEVLDFYEDEPAGLIYVNYCTPEDCKRILESGKKDRTKGGEGFLADLKTGN